MTHQHSWSTVTSLQLKKRFRIHLLIFLLATPATWLVWYFTDRSYPWPLWQTPAWATGLLFHYLGVTFFKKRKAS